MIVSEKHMILLIGGEKGGPSKTTIVTNLAAMRTDEIEDVLLVDTDRQPTRVIGVLLGKTMEYFLELLVYKNTTNRLGLKSWS